MPAFCTLNQSNAGWLCVQNVRQQHAARSILDVWRCPPVLRLGFLWWKTVHRCDASYMRQHRTGAEKTSARACRARTFSSACGTCTGRRTYGAIRTRSTPTAFRRRTPTRRLTAPGRATGVAILLLSDCGLLRSSQMLLQSISETVGPGSTVVNISCMTTADGQQRIRSGICQSHTQGWRQGL